MFFHLICKLMKDRSLFKYVLRGYPVIDNEYDSVVAYAGPMDFISYFVVKKIVAKRKFNGFILMLQKFLLIRCFQRIYIRSNFTVSNEAKTS